MTALYWLALVLGGGLAVLSLFGDLLGFDHGGDAGGDLGGDTGDGDVGAHAGDGSHGDQDGMHILSLRSATYFLFAFGAVGVLLNWAWHGSLRLPIFLVSAATGLAASTFSIMLFRWVTRTASGELLHDSSLIGLAAEVVLPIRGDSGKVVVARSGREYELIARPFEHDATDPQNWTSVVVVDIVDGTALVSPIDALPPAEPES